MSGRTTTAIAAVAALAGAAAGYFAGYGARGVPARDAGAPQATSDRGKLLQISERDRDRRPRSDESYANVQPAPSSRFGEMRSVMDRAESADANDLARLLDDALAISNPRTRDAALQLSFARLVEVDPGGALARARTLEPALAAIAVPFVIGAWSAQDLDAAMDAAFLLEPSRTRMNAAREILLNRADLDASTRRSIAQRLGEPDHVELLLLESSVKPTAAAAGPAIAEATSLAGRPRRADALARIASLIALDSPESALALGKSIGDPDDRRAYERGAIEIWARHDPFAASQWLERQPAATQGQLAYPVAAELARNDPRLALDWANRIDPDGDKGPWSSVLMTIAQADPMRAVELASSAEPGSARSNSLSVAIAYLARQDPALAAVYLDRIPRGQQREGALQSIAMQMGRDDPKRAIDWLDALDDPSGVDGARLQLADRWASTDAKAALAYADRLPEREQLSWRQQVLSTMAQSNPEAALAALSQLRNEPNYENLVTMVAWQLARGNVDTLIKLVEREPDARLRDSVLASATQQIASQSIPDAKRMLERIQDERQKVTAVRAMVQQLGRDDADAALDWVRSMPAGPMRDQGYAGLIQWFESSDQMEAAIRRVQDPAVREDVIAMSAMALTGRGRPQEARDLLRRYPLPPDKMRQLESRLTAFEERRLR